MRYLALALLVAAPLVAGQEERVPGERWMRYADPAEAGFDADELEAAHSTWEGLASSAFIVVADGAVVAGWGDLERRFMCHSVRKSFLSALYGIFWDRGQLELNKTLADLGIDDEPDPLLESEKQARIIDLLQARSGVFHSSAYSGRFDARPRGSEGPGMYFAYNNWDFNTLAAILTQEVKVDVFHAFDEHFGRPLGMQDWRVSDGYYHYQRELSKYPAYPFRMSARDAARFGLLFAREGLWGERKILSRHWVRRSTAMCSIDNDVMGYAYMWWVFREPRFEPHGMVAALGVGNNMIAACPDSDLVFVNRANTYADQDTPMGPLLDLIEAILNARKGEPSADPRLVPLEESARAAPASVAGLEGLVGRWAVPAADFGWPAQETCEIVLVNGRLVWTMPGWGTFALDPQPDGSFLEEDSLARYYPVRDASGAFAGIASAQDIADGAVSAAERGQVGRAQELLALLPETEAERATLARSLMRAFEGDREGAVEAVGALAKGAAGRVENAVNGLGYAFLRAERLEAGLLLFELNTQVFPRSANAWDSLAEAHMNLGHDAEAREFYQASLDLNANNANARAKLEELEGRAVSTPR